MPFLLMAFTPTGISRAVDWLLDFDKRIIRRLVLFASGEALLVGI